MKVELNSRQVKASIISFKLTGNNWLKQTRARSCFVEFQSIHNTLNLINVCLNSVDSSDTSIDSILSKSKTFLNYFQFGRSKTSHKFRNVTKVRHFSSFSLNFSSLSHLSNLL